MSLVLNKSHFKVQNALNLPVHRIYKYCVPLKNICLPIFEGAASYYFSRANKWH